MRAMQVRHWASRLVGTIVVVGAFIAGGVLAAPPAGLAGSNRDPSSGGCTVTPSFASVYPPAAEGSYQRIP
jgi:hypothetical protein